VPFENYSDGQSFCARLALLIVGWAAAGVLLYVLSTFLPGEVLVIIGIAAWAIVKLDPSPKNKSLASWLCGTTALLTFVCAVALRITAWHWHDYVLTRLIFVGVCLGPASCFLIGEPTTDHRRAGPMALHAPQLREKLKRFNSCDGCALPIFPLVRGPWVRGKGASHESFHLQFALHRIVSRCECFFDFGGCSHSTTNYQ
jgi:hypothetical protein